MVVVGLGNPGPPYAGTRHNIGFMVTHRLAQRWSIGLKKTLCRSKIGEGQIHHHPVHLALPQTLMNASGKAVGCLIRRWKLDLSDLLVVCDDVSLPLGVIRLRAKGSEGGHRGLASILEETQSQEIPRLRVGIQTKQAGQDLTAFVLGRFTAPEKRQMEESVKLAADACEVWVTRGMYPAMNQFNQKVKVMECQP